MILTCRYTAAVIWFLSNPISRTPNRSCDHEPQKSAPKRIIYCNQFERGAALTEKKWVSCMSQKKRTVINAKYVPSTTPIEKISRNFQLSGSGDGFTLSFEIVMIVPEAHKKARSARKQEEVRLVDQG